LGLGVFQIFGAVVEPAIVRRGWVRVRRGVNAGSEVAGGTFVNDFAIQKLLAVCGKDFFTA